MRDSIPLHQVGKMTARQRHMLQLQTHVNVTTPEEIVTPGGFPQGFPVSFNPSAKHMTIYMTRPSSEYSLKCGNARLSCCLPEKRDQSRPLCTPLHRDTHCLLDGLLHGTLVVPSLRSKQLFDLKCMVLVVGSKLIEYCLPKFVLQSCLIWCRGGATWWPSL